MTQITMGSYSVLTSIYNFYDVVINIRFN